jgi:isopentenyl-diphosphate delta-isomerase
MTAHDERDRKAEHIQLSLDDRMQLHGHFFDAYYFEHEALPELDLQDVQISTHFLEKAIEAPLLISCMTGGTGDAVRINRHLAEAAEETGIALGVGSQRKALEDPGLVESFQVRQWAPSVPLLANLGAVQLNYGYGVKECRAAVEMIEADALVLHLNPLQEAIQPEGQCDFTDLISKVGKIVEQLEVPVIVKEVGSGISGKLATRLWDVGVRIVDTAGLGGTSWARIEGARARDAEIGELFAGWGIPTPSSIRQIRHIPGLQIIGSGGVSNGLDVAKAIALGADLAGMAQPFLVAADRSTEAVVDKVRRISRELGISMFCAGARNLEALQRIELRHRGED